MLQSLRSTVVTAGLLAVASAAHAQGFVDPANTLDPGWVTDRYAPNQFVSESFGGGNSYRLDISTADSYNNRPAPYQGASFYNYQGIQRAANVTGPDWLVSADVFLSADFLSGTELRDAELWARDNAALEADAYYPSIGIVRDHTGDTGDFTAGAGLDTHWELFDPNDGSISYSTYNVTAGWHNMAILASPTSFTYLVDNAAVGSVARIAGSDPDLRTVFLQGYNFSDATNPGSSYSARFDNIIARPVPEPASMAALGLGALGLLKRRRKSA